MNYFLTKSRFFSIFLLFVLMFNSFPVLSKVYFLEADYYQTTKKNQKIIVGRGEILSSEESIGRIAITDPSIADLQLLNEKEVFVRGRVLGMTTLLVWEKGKSSPSRFELSIVPDIEELTNQLLKLDKGIMVEYIAPSYTTGTSIINEDVEAPLQQPGEDGEESTAGNFPDLDVESEVGEAIGSGRVLLTGKVKNADVIAKAIQIAGGFVGDTGIMIVSQAGGQIVGENFDTVGTGGGQAFGGRITDSGISFTTNRTGNINRGLIITSEEGNVVSFLQVEDQPQIAVSVRFYEISRTLSRSLGFNAVVPGRSFTGLSLLGGPGVSSISAGQTALHAATMFDAPVGANPVFEVGPTSLFGRATGIVQGLGTSATGAIFDNQRGIGVILQALQDRGEVKSLSEPTLIITNGEPASFLAGGEVPVQSSVITNGGAAQTITYEPFGIKVTFLPTLKEDGKIHLQLVPEIREIDTELSDFVSPGGGTGLRPPAFKTRRSETQVELFSGEAFAISGLLSEANTRSLRKMPGVGDVPILGSLFRSKAFNRGESEVLIVVAPEVVKPSRRGEGTKLTLDNGPPEEEFNFLSPMEKPFYMINDEVGPDSTTPVAPDRYYGDMNAPDINPARRDWNSSSNEDNLQKLDADLRRRQDQLLETQLKLKEDNKKLVGLQNEFLQTKNQLLAKQQKIRSKTDEIVELSNLISEKQKLIKKSPTQDKINEYKKVFSLLEMTKREVLQLGSQIKADTNRLKDVQEQLERTNKQVIENEKKLKNTISHIGDIKPMQQNLIKSKEVVGLENRIDKLSEEAQKKEFLLKEKEDKIALLQRELSEKSKKVQKLDKVFEDKANKMRRIRTSFAKRVSPEQNIRDMELTNQNLQKNNNKINELERKWIQSELDKSTVENNKLALVEQKAKRLELVEQEKIKQKQIEEEAKKLLVRRKKEEAKKKKEAEELAKKEAKRQKELAEKQEQERKAQELAAKREQKLKEEEGRRLAREAARKKEEDRKRTLAEVKRMEKERIAAEKKKKEEAIKLAKKHAKEEKARKLSEIQKKKQQLAEAKRVEKEKAKQEALKQKETQRLAKEEAKRQAEKQKQLVAEAKRIEKEKAKQEVLKQKEVQRLAKEEAKMQAEKQRKLAEEAKKLKKEQQRIAKLEKKEKEKLAKEAALKEKERRKQIIAESKRQSAARRKAEEMKIREGKLLAKKAAEEKERLEKQKEEQRKQILAEAKRIEKEKAKQEKEKRKQAEKIAKEAARKEKELKKLQEKHQKEALAKKKQLEEERKAANENKNEKVSKKNNSGGIFGFGKTKAEHVSRNDLKNDTSYGTEFSKNMVTQELVKTSSADRKVVAKYHTVKSGESIATIANSYYGNKSLININKILNANNLPDSNAIYDGEKLLIPVK